jgi:hypothetical protein
MKALNGWFGRALLLLLFIGGAVLTLGGVVQGQLGGGGDEEMMFGWACQGPNVECAECELPTACVVQSTNTCLKQDGHDGCELQLNRLQCASQFLSSCGNKKKLCGKTVVSMCERVLGMDGNLVDCIERCRVDNNAEGPCAGCEN